MQEASVISDYLESLANALRFDRSLSRCVLQEVEDHLREAAAADPACDRLEAERRAIANFGDPHAIAAQFAVVSLAKQTKRVGVAVILVVAGVFIVMKARVAWYAVTQWVLSDDMRAVGGIVGLVDRYSFWFSVIIGIGGFAYISGCRIRQSFYPAYRKQLNHFVLLCTAATGALILSVISDGVLTALQLLGAELCARFLVPIFSMAIEIACVGVLVFHIRSVAQRMAFTTALLKT
jgi:hypothetical protein